MTSFCSLFSSSSIDDKLGRFSRHFMDEISVFRALMENRDVHAASGARSLTFVLLQLSDSRLEQEDKG